MADHTPCPHCGNVTATTAEGRCATCDGPKVHNLGAVDLEVEHPDDAPTVNREPKR
jgi:hypothetical protein